MMNNLATREPVLHNSLTAALDESEVTLMTSEAPALSVGIVDGGPSDLQPDSDETLAKLGTLVDQDDRVHQKFAFSWSEKGGKFSVQGRDTRHGLTLAAMVAMLGIVVCHGRPTTDAYIPMAGVVMVALAGEYLEKRK